MEIDNQYPEKEENISENSFFNLLFLERGYLTMQDPIFKLYISIKNITVEGQVCQIFYIGPRSFSMKFRNLEF